MEHRRPALLIGKGRHHFRLWHCFSGCRCDRRCNLNGAVEIVVSRVWQDTQKSKRQGRCTPAWVCTSSAFEGMLSNPSPSDFARRNSSNGRRHPIDRDWSTVVADFAASYLQACGSASNFASCKPGVLARGPTSRLSGVEFMGMCRPKIDWAVMKLACCESAVLGHEIAYPRRMERSRRRFRGHCRPGHERTACDGQMLGRSEDER